MATLSAIGLTAAAGVCGFVISMIWFGVATLKQSSFIAARCRGRPKTVIHNPNPNHECQARGNVYWGWIPWVMKLTYATMISGVPGTGTRDGGLSGLMLKVNLDGIVLIRFHHLCLRVSGLAVVLYILIVLPVFATNQCSIDGDDGDFGCLGPDATNYDRFTIANVPFRSANNSFWEDDEVATLTSEDTIEETEILPLFLPTSGEGLVRLYMVVFVSWIITWYTYALLEKEWRDILALRRVYFLEADLWGDRTAELHETLLREERERNNESRNGDDNDIESAKNYAKTREPWIHHPEQRDTVPNIELYSVLVGGLPSLPTEAYLQEDVKAVFSRKQSIDWQLAVTSAFFDHCVPNQPGFSSSVAAVTILPDASQITEAWKHWYKTAAKVRRLRFIRKQISKRKKALENRNKSDAALGDESEGQQSSTRSLYRKLSTRKLSLTTKKEKKKKKKRKSSVYSDSDEKKKYFSEVLGNTNDLEVEKNLLHALQLGPEQTAVYSREFAQGAANMAPYGWNESKVRNAPLSQLLTMEKEAITAVREASHYLREAQERIADNSIDGELYDDEDLNELMESARGPLTPGIVDIESQEYIEVPLNDQMTKTEDKTRRSTFRENWLKFTGRKSCEVDDEVENLSTNDSTTENTVDGSRSNRRSENTVDRSTSNRRSLLQNLQVIAPTSQSSENRKSGFDDLGLEAGLFLEQKYLSNGLSQNKPRNLLKRSRSAEDISEFYRDESGKFSIASFENDEEHDIRSSLRTSFRRSFRRSNSADDIDILQEEIEVNVVAEFDTGVVESDPKSMKRTLQGGEKTEEIEAPSSTTLEEKSEDELEREKLGYERIDYKIPGDNAKRSATSRTDSIWDKIASEHDRRSQIRKHLDSISQSSEEGKQKRRVSFTNTVAMNTTNGKPNSDSSLNSASPPRSENISPKRKTDARMFSIDESSKKSWSKLDSEKLSRKTSIGAMNRRDYSEKDHPSPMTEEDVRLAHAFEEKAGLRRRQAKTTVDRLSATMNEKWSKVVQIANESSSRRTKDDKADPIESGSYSVCSFYSLLDRMMVILKNLLNLSQLRNNSADIVDQFDLAGESTFAVVTFTSRQAAVAARYCLADSRGTARWNTVSEIPSPPLADAPVCNLSSPRGCVRPVTISINDRQKLIRQVLALAILGTIYIFYIIPLTQVQSLLSTIRDDLPATWQEQDITEYIFSGLMPALVLTGFYALCPPMFKAIANFGSNATSAACAESSALRYFWWFMIVSAFIGITLADAVIESFQEKELNLGSYVEKVVITSAKEIPLTISPTWLNWIIVRALLVLPTQYIVQMNTFFFSWLRLKALARAVQGGGSGGPIPYRIYVDSGVVMLCLLALAPASPLIAIAVFVYFLFSVPMLRWVLIFLYKPKFDIGGARFPFIFDMCVSGMLAGQILLGTMLVIRRAVGPSLVAFLTLIPIIFYRWTLLNRYLKAFTDVALLQTSLLDGWDTTEESCVSKREEFRQFLVDCHKAAYVPVCIASDEAKVITSEPAVVMPLETDVDEDIDDMTSVYTDVHSVSGIGIESSHGISRADNQTLYHPHEPQRQYMRMMRRASFGASTITLNTGV